MELLKSDDVTENPQKGEEGKTTEKYWDCECETDYIHPKTQKTCLICGAKAEEQPDSIIDEVIALGLPL